MIWSKAPQLCSISPSQPRKNRRRGGMRARRAVTRLSVQHRTRLRGISYRNCRFDEPLEHREVRRFESRPRGFLHRKRLLPFPDPPKATPPGRVPKAEHHEDFVAGRETTG